MADITEPNNYTSLHWISRSSLTTSQHTDEGPTRIQTSYAAAYASASTHPQSTSTGQYQIPIRREFTGERGRKHTAPGSNFPSSCSLAQSFVRGISITPSIITWETWTPFGPNSRASDWASARRANLPVAKAAKFAEPFTLAVAPVKIRVGGYCSPVDFWRSGRVLLAKLNAPILSSIN